MTEQPDEDGYDQMFTRLWNETPGTTFQEKLAAIERDGSRGEVEILRGGYVRTLNRGQPRRIVRPPYNPRKEVPRPLSRPYWTPPDAHRDRAVYDTGIGIRVASYADDDDDGWDDTDARERWRRHHRRGTEWAA